MDGQDAKRNEAGDDLAAAVIAAAREFGLGASCDLVASVRARAEALGLPASAHASPTPNEVAAAWRGFLDNDRTMRADEKNQPESICLLAAIHRLAFFGKADAKAAFRSQSMNLERSVVEMALRLGSRLYMLGRTKTLFGFNPLLSGRLLRAAIRHLSEAIEMGHMLSDRARAGLHGMRGAARVLLSREMRSVADLETAAADLETSRRLGNETPENWEYRREAGLRLCQWDPTPERIGSAATLLAEAGRRDRQFYLDLANHRGQRAMLLTDAEGKSGSDLLDAVAAASAGLALPQGAGPTDRMLRGARGFAHMLRSQQLRQSDTVESETALDDAIEDLREAALDGIGGASLSRCLMFRAQRMRNADPCAARDVLAEALTFVPLAKSELSTTLRRQLEAAVEECGMRDAVGREDWPAVLSHCETLAPFGEESETHALSIAGAMRLLLDPKRGLDPISAKRAREMAVRHIGRLVEMTSVLPKEADYSTMLLKQVAGLSHRLDDGRQSERTLDLYRKLVERERPPGSVSLAHCGDAALQIAKRLFLEGSPGEASALLEDSIDYLKRALGAHVKDGGPVPGFQEVVCHSKLGEAHLRRREPTAVGYAIRHLENARRLGNETPELLGLLGDAHYRRGYFNGSTADLHTAAAYKAAARAGGASSRENFSVVGRIHARLFERSGDHAELRSALEAVLAAHRTAPSWPWPLFQLAEMCGAVASSDVIERLPPGLVGADTRRLLESADRPGLLELGVRLAIESEEFKRTTLGGRTAVFVLDDPHGLLRATMVLKPTTRRSADFEAASARSFAEHISNKTLAGFEVPTPIGIVPTGPRACVYAMERAPAEPLARMIAGGGGATRAEMEEALTRSVDFLAEFHRWAGLRPAGLEPLHFLTQQLDESLADLGAGPTQREQAQRAFQSLLDPSLPLARKKDAHPENWLVTGSGRIVMIDLESTRPLPLVYELVQLVDDLPAYQFDRPGWAARQHLSERYWSATMGTRMPLGIVSDAYLGSLAHRCAVGTARLRRKARKPTSSSALGSTRLKHAHYRAAAAHLATCADPAPRLLGDLIGALLIRLGSANGT